jgi:carboxyl-terminal processing protease
MKSFRLAVWTLALIATSAPLALSVQAAESAPSSDRAMNTWSRDVWTAAQSGASSRAIDLLERIPENAQAGDLAAGVARFKANVAQREEDRAKRVTELREEIAKAAAEDNILDGLKSAIELQLLSHDKNAVTAQPEIKRMIDEARKQAVESEQKGDWLLAHSLYARLHLLFEESGIYKEDLNRLGQRRTMLRLYVPERLHELVNEERRAQGEEDLPPFNKGGDDWRKKLEGIEEGMIFRSLGAAAEMHVDRTQLSAMLLGGYRAIHTMVTTDDLSGAFPRLKDKRAVEEYLAFVDGRINELTRNPAKGDYSELVLGMRKLTALSADTVQIDPHAIMHEFAEGAMAQLDDFSSIIWPADMQQFQRTTEGAFKGVGIQISLNDAGELIVVTPLAGTPAARAGIRPGDIIRKVNGESTLGLSPLDAVERITGPQGSPVMLSIERDGAEEMIDYRLVREEIPIHSVKGWERNGPEEMDWNYFIDPVNKVGYLRLVQFTNNTTKEFSDAIEQMKRGGVRGLILDLRGNPGGLLSEAVGVVSQFVNSGVVVTQEDNMGNERGREVARFGQAKIGSMPVVALVNGGSASASEIVAGCLQDYRKAVILGERSFGKGSVQNVLGLGAHAAFKLTTQYYRLPGRDGKPGDTNWGIQPDVEVEVLPKQYGEALQLRQNSDVVEFDDRGNLVQREDRADPNDLILKGLDPQLEAALLLIQSQVASDVIGARAER